MAALPRPSRPRRLRTKLSLLLGLIALLACVVAAALTYYLTRDALVDQRTSEAHQRTLINAYRVRDELRAGSDGATLGNFVSNTLKPDQDGFLLVITLDDGESYPNGPLQWAHPEALPESLRQAVDSGNAASQRFSVDGAQFVAVGIPLPEVDAEYYEAVSLDSTEATLRRISLLLTAGSLVAVLLAGAGGIWAGRRVLRPLGNVVEAAEEIASGDLTTRAAPQTDDDLRSLVDAFNGMADAVQQRVEREARFASDVSHELRSPITALRAATDLLDKRRDELPERTQQIVDVIITQVRRFDGMVIDLLELASMDAGAADVHLEAVDVVNNVARTAARLDLDVPITVDGGGPRPVWARADRLRLDRIVGNMLQNAVVHGGGPIRVDVVERDRIDAEAGSVDIAVEDAGPGVAVHERELIFERYSRGSESRHRVGTGLGLALVTDNARLLGGRAWVEDRPGGGSRFVVRLRADDDRDDGNSHGDDADHSTSSGDNAGGTHDGHGDVPPRQTTATPAVVPQEGTR